MSQLRAIVVDEVNRRMISEGPKESDKNAYLSQMLQNNSPLSKKEDEPIKEEIL